MFKQTKSLFTGKTADDVEPGQGNQQPKKRRMFFYFSVIMYLLGFLTAAHAVMSTRTSQGAIAWAIGSISFPYVTVPAYWVLDR
jgi:cardiolipin synthase